MRSGGTPQIRGNHCSLEPRFTQRPASYVNTLRKAVFWGTEECPIDAKLPNSSTRYPSQVAMGPQVHRNVHPKAVVQGQLLSPHRPRVRAQGKGRGDFFPRPAFGISSFKQPIHRGVVPRVAPFKQRRQRRLVPVPIGTKRIHITLGYMVAHGSGAHHQDVSSPKLQGFV